VDSRWTPGVHLESSGVHLNSVGECKVLEKSGKNCRSGICLFLGLGGRGSKYKCVQFDISCIASQYKGIYSNEKKVARIVDQEFACFWAWEREEVSTSVCSLR